MQKSLYDPLSARRLLPYTDERDTAGSEGIAQEAVRIFTNSPKNQDVLDQLLSFDELDHELSMNEFDDLLSGSPEADSGDFKTILDQNMDVWDPDEFEALRGSSPKPKNSYNLDTIFEPSIDYEMMDQSGFDPLENMCVTDPRQILEHPGVEQNDNQSMLL